MHRTGTNSPRAAALALATALLAGPLASAPARAAGAASEAAQVQARQALKSMGVDYTPTRFAQAAGDGDLVAVRRFVDAGMDVNAGDGAAIGLAAGRGRADVVRWLLERGARPTSQSLQFARTRGHRDVERMLVDAGAKE